MWNRSRHFSSEFVYLHFKKQIWHILQSHAWGCLHAAFGVLENHTAEKESLACPSHELTPDCAVVQYFQAFFLSFRVCVEKQECVQFFPTNVSASQSWFYVNSLHSDD